MRDLLLHEQRFIRNILRSKGFEESEGKLRVVEEYYAPPRTNSVPRFNNDFVMRFEGATEAIRTKSLRKSILPNSMGVEVFLTLDEITKKPIMTELLEGEGLPMKYFKEQIEVIELEFAKRQFPIRFSRMTYSRIFVIENDICFAGFPASIVPQVEGTWRHLSQDSKSSIACCMKGKELVCIDGWIQTHIADTDLTLEVIPKN